MIDWRTIRPALLSLLCDVSGLQSVWIDKRRPYIDPVGQAAVLVRVRSTQDVGVDDRRYVDLGLPIPQASLEETIAGHRLVSLDVRVESFRHDDDRFAFNATEKIRTALFFQTSLARLRAANVALVRVSTSIDQTGVIQDDRVTSVALLEVILNVGFCTANEGAANHVHNIETVDSPVDNTGTVINPPC